MKALGAVVLVFLVVAGCSANPVAPASRRPPSPSSPPSSAPLRFETYAGAYRTAGGATYVVNGSGHIARLADGWFRQLYATPAADQLIVGSAFMVETPRTADVTFHVTGGRADRMTITPISGPVVTAERLQFKETDVRVAAEGAELAATITEPLTPGTHPGIVVVHGSERGTRILYGIWVGLYASLGFTVLAYDKRGAGDSTGRWPGEFPRGDALAIFADDAAACWRKLSAWPGVDPLRVGFHGGSQGGWTVPLAIQRQAATAFAVLVSGPAVSVDQQGVWQSYTAGSHRVPTASQSEIDAALRSPGSGYNPLPILQATATPILWLNGEKDGQVPTALNTEILRGLNKPNFDVQVLPATGHGLLESGTGLVDDDPKAPGLAHDLFTRIAAWLAGRVGTSPTP